jgi:hypothetical protein
VGGEPVPLVSQLEGDKEGSETFVTSAGVVQDVEEEDARVGGGRCKLGDSRAAQACERLARGEAPRPRGAVGASPIGRPAALTLPAARRARSLITWGRRRRATCTL